MYLFSPAFLLFLFPFAALVIWGWIGRRVGGGVPFFELWGGPVSGGNGRREFRRPPGALLCALAAIFLAIVGASAPVIRARSARTAVTLIVDRGVTLSTDARQDELRKLPIHPSNVILVPPTDLADWRNAPPSAVNTRELLRSAVAQALHDSPGPVMLFSDQRVDQTDRRLSQIFPQALPENVGIVRLGLSLAGQPERSQLMVRVRNQSAATISDLIVTTAGETVTKSITLPPRDTEQNFFVDLGSVGQTLEAKLTVADDLPADNVAWLVRQRAWPKVEAHSALPPDVGRMIAVYGRDRPASETSRRVVVVDSLFALPANDPGIAVLRDGTAALPTTGAVGVKFGSHPVIAGVDWKAIANDAVAAESPGEGWQTLVRAGPRVLVAVRDQPARQVWVGFNSPGFPDTRDFVIFWSNVLNWVGEGGQRFASEPMQMTGDAWLRQTAPVGKYDQSPGIYSRAGSVEGDGQMRAMNALDVVFNPPPAAGRQQDGNGAEIIAGERSLGPALALAAVLLLSTAVLLWARRSPHTPLLS